MWKGAQDVLNSPYLLKRLLQNTLICGVIYLGSIFLYNFIVNTIFRGGFTLDPNQSGNIILQIIYIIVRLLVSIVYNAWLLFIYIVAMTLSTFWVQDIFDELIQIKLKRILGVDKKVKNPGEVLYEM